MTNSRTCKKDCIDSSKVFCPLADHKSGYCCSETETCPRADVCSNDISSDTNLKYWSCNYNLNCSSRGYSLAPPFGGSNAYTLTPTGTVYKENLCPWVLTYPAGASNNDTVTLRVNLMDNCNVYYMIG